MKIEILGSGGATLTPRLFSDSRVSKQAREKGLPYSRMGPAYFVHDAQLLIDTPEEINLMLSRSNIERIKAAVYSHCTLTTHLACGFGKPTTPSGTGR